MRGPAYCGAPHFYVVGNYETFLDSRFMYLCHARCR